MDDSVQHFFAPGCSALRGLFALHSSALPLVVHHWLALDGWAEVIRVAVQFSHVVYTVLRFQMWHLDASNMHQVFRDAYFDSTTLSAVRARQHLQAMRITQRNRVKRRVLCTCGKHIRRFGCVHHCIAGFFERPGAPTALLPPSQASP